MPSSYSAYEMRWFGTGDVPSEIDAILSNIRNGETHRHIENNRNDIYFPVEGQDRIGMKLRDKTASEEEGKFEIKMLTQRQNEPWHVGAALGWAEEWQKIGWNFEKSHQDQMESLLEKGYGVDRVCIWKDRTQWKFVPDGTSTPVAMDPKKKPDRACMVERTCIKIVSNSEQAEGTAMSWSVAIEAFDDVTGKREETLRVGLQDVLGSYKGPDLQSENSFGYPRQILNHMKRS